MLELQSGLEFPDVRHLQSLYEWFRPPSKCPALDAAEQNVSEDPGGIQLRRARSEKQAAVGETSHGQTGLRIQGQN